METYIITDSIVAREMAKIEGCSNWVELPEKFRTNYMTLARNLRNVIPASAYQLSLNDFVEKYLD